MHANYLDKGISSWPSGQGACSIGGMEKTTIQGMLQIKPMSFLHLCMTILKALTAVLSLWISLTFMNEFYFTMFSRKRLSLLTNSNDLCVFPVILSPIELDWGTIYRPFQVFQLISWLLCGTRWLILSLFTIIFFWDSKFGFFSSCHVIIITIQRNKNISISVE